MPEYGWRIADDIEVWPQSIDQHLNIDLADTLALAALSPNLFIAEFASKGVGIGHGNDIGRLNG